MAKSTIVVTFNTVPSTYSIITLENSLAPTQLLENQFVGLRQSQGESTIGAGTPKTAYFYSDAISTDYGSSGLYDIILLKNNVVAITARQSNVVFSELYNTTSGAVTVNISNEIEDEPITIDDISFSTASSLPCQFVQTNVTTNVLAVEYSIEDSVWVLNPNNPFNFDLTRGTSVDLIVRDVNLNEASQTVTAPAILSVPNTYLDIVSTPTGSTLTVTHYSTYLLNLEYSLDNTVWRTSNTFSGLTDGDYNLYVRDQFGCQITTGFDIDLFQPDITVTESFKYLAKEMSIRYKHNVVWDNCDVYKTEENTLSCEEKVYNPYEYTQYFQSCDIITTQFLSNYETLEANVIRENGTKVPLTINKKSTNLGATDKRDAFYYRRDDDTVGVYFTSGNTYDYDTSVINGDYALNGDLPNYGAVGNYIYLDGYGWYTIVDIVYDESKDADVLVIELEYTGEESSIIVSSLYNQKNYDVYEYSIYMGAYENEDIQVELLQSDTKFGEYNYLSEHIKVYEYCGGTIEVIWYNTSDTWVFYSTGLKNKARVPFLNLVAGNDSTLEIHKTDVTTLMLDSESYETASLELVELSTGIKRQLTKAFLHKEIYLDKEQYITNTVPESEGVPFTNMYNLTVELTKAGKVFNSEWSGNGNAIDNVELVGIIQNNGEYIKMQ